VETRTLEEVKKKVLFFFMEERNKKAEEDIYLYIYICVWQVGGAWGSGSSSSLRQSIVLDCRTYVLGVQMMMKDT
jgi:hypothetical protein